MRRRAAFTLVEMLCVLVIAGIIISIVAHGLVNSINWSHLGFEEEVIADQLEQALDFIEQDVRSAIDVDVDYFDASDSRNLSDIRTSLELRLLAADENDPRIMGRIIYQLVSSTGDVLKENPPERPKPDGTLYRRRSDSTHSGANQPLAQYLNTDFRHPWGLRVAYYGRDGTACSLAQEVYSVEVRLIGRTKDNTLVTRTRMIPLAAKFE